MYWLIFLLIAIVLFMYKSNSDKLQEYYSNLSKEQCMRLDNSYDAKKFASGYPTPPEPLHAWTKKASITKLQLYNGYDEFDRKNAPLMKYVPGGACQSDNDPPLWEFVAQIIRGDQQGVSA